MLEAPGISLHDFTDTSTQYEVHEVSQHDGLALQCLLSFRTDGIITMYFSSISVSYFCGHRAWYLFVLFCLFVFFHPIYYLTPFCSLPPSRNSDAGSHSRLFPPPTYCGSSLAFLSREDFSSFFPRRLASNCAYPHARRSQQLILFYVAKIFKISPQGDSNSRTNTSSIRGLPLVHRGDCGCME